MSDTFPGPVAVTGASGFIASWIVKLLLEQGAVVHGTVRSLADRAKVAHLDQLSLAYPGRLRLFEAALLEPAGFAAAFAGCAVVMHTASPFVTRRVRDAERELIAPALEGTRNVLRAAGEAGTVGRVVLTSSLAAAYGDSCDVRRSAGSRTVDTKPGVWGLKSLPLCARFRRRGTTIAGRDPRVLAWCRRSCTRRPQFVHRSCRRVARCASPSGIRRCTAPSPFRPAR
jgi:NAD(P)-dependent dehydrogenase (short-subunit alcohol dehydrogenase family)